MKTYVTNPQRIQSLTEYLKDQLTKGLNIQRAIDAMDYYKGILDTTGYSPGMFKILESIIAAWKVIYVKSLANQPAPTLAPTGAAPAPTPHYPVQSVATQSDQAVEAHKEEISEELKRLKEYRFKPNIY